MEYAFIVDITKCVGCYACEVACKQEHNISSGPGWIRVFPAKTGSNGEQPHAGYTVTHCVHCSRPLCIAVCPTEAITKREDGIVMIHEELCIGCKECIAVCPLGAMLFDEIAAVARKCTLCVDRLDKGLKPACAAACPSHCIYCGDVNSITEQLGQQKLFTWYKATGA